MDINSDFHAKRISQFWRMNNKKRNLNHRAKGGNMIEALDLKQRFNFSSQYDKNEPKTVYTIRPLSGTEMLKFSRGRDEDIVNMLLTSIIEISNFPDRTPEMTIKDIVDLTRVEVLGELLLKVNQINGISRQEEKN